MNKILIEVSVGELLDKISILEIKKERIKDTDKLKFINDEYLILKKQLDENITLSDQLKKLYEELKAINTKLWDIEDGKRTAEKNKDFGKNFIELARNVYKFNDERAKIKLKINEKLGSSIKEVKSHF